VFDNGTARFAVNYENPDVVLRADGELDISSRDAHNIVLSRVGEIVESCPCRQIVVDMRGLEFCDSSGIVLLLRLQQCAQQWGMPYTLREPSEAVRRVLLAAGLSDLLGPV
jgi:anti-anti-sigma factor